MVKRTFFAAGKTGVLCSRLMLAAALLPVSPGFFSVSMAAPTRAPFEAGVYFTTNSSMMDNLNALTGKPVTLTLDGGKDLSGIIKSVGAHLVHLQTNKENRLIDWLIRIESLQAIEVQLGGSRRDK